MHISRTPSAFAARMAQSVLQFTCSMVFMCGAPLFVVAVGDGDWCAAVGRWPSESGLSTYTCPPLWPNVPDALWYMSSLVPIVPCAARWHTASKLLAPPLAPWSFRRAVCSSGARARSHAGHLANAACLRVSRESMRPIP